MLLCSESTTCRSLALNRGVLWEKEGRSGYSYFTGVPGEHMTRPGYSLQEELKEGVFMS